MKQHPLKIESISFDEIFPDLYYSKGVHEPYEFCRAVFYHPGFRNDISRLWVRYGLARKEKGDPYILAPKTHFGHGIFPITLLRTCRSGDKYTLHSDFEEVVRCFGLSADLLKGYQPPVFIDPATGKRPTWMKT